MKNWIYQLFLAGIVGVVSLGFSPTPAVATHNPSPQIQLPSPAPLVAPPGGDFSDADFAQADQAELGTLAGGDGVGLLLFILLVVLLVLFILWFLNSGPNRHTHLEIRNDRGYHESTVNHSDHNA